MNGISNGTGTNENEKGSDDDLQPSTSRAGMMDEPKWNISTRQLYEDNLKSTGMAPHQVLYHDHSPRERIPSVSESTSSDDSCVYMYKGDNENGHCGNENKVANCSSPEMDYLEMDFDPCQSNGHESSDGSYSCDNAELEKHENLNQIADNVDDECETPAVNVDEKSPSGSPWFEDINRDEMEPVPSTSNHKDPKVNEQSASITHSNPVEIISFGDLNESDEPVDITRSFSMKSVLMEHRAESSGSNCCISSIIHALYTLNGAEITLSEDDIKNKLLGSNMNESSLSIVDYLYYVSKRGLTISDVMISIETIFDGCITTRFFIMHPQIKINLSSWLLYWLKRDVIPILSVNFHLTGDDCGNSVNTSWHFQVVRTVSQKGIHLFSQFDCVSEDIIMELLNNPSEVLISRDEVMTRWTPESDLTQLMTPPDHSWKKYNVLGQIVNVIREGITGKSEDEMKHIKIPSPHRTGILLLIRSDNPNQKELLEANELPLFENLS